jgi:hypothetical protein
MGEEREGSEQIVNGEERGGQGGRRRRDGGDFFRYQ